MATKNFTTTMDIAYGLLDGTEIAKKAQQDDLGRTIKSSYAGSINVTQDSEDYSVTFTLYAKDGTVLSTKTITLDSSSELVSASLDSVNQQIILTKANGNTVVCGISNIYTTIGAVATDLSEHEADTSNPHSVTKSQVGLGNVDNTSDLNKPISTATQTALDTLDNKITVETQARESADSTEATTRATADTTLTNNLASEVATRTSEISAIQGKLNKSVVTDASVSAADDGVTITLNRENLNTAATSTKDVELPLANSSTAGVMSPTSVTAIQQLRTDVDALKGQNVRLLYTASSTPTAAQIRAFVIAQGYTDETKWASISVVVKNTNHIWRYYANDGWKDAGLDAVSQFTNTVAGIILGSENDGQVYAEDDGTGSVVGWDTLKGRVLAVETGKQDTLTFDNVPTSGSNNVVKSGGVYDALPTIEEVGF